MGLTLIRQLPAPLLPLSFTPNSITVILSTADSPKSQLSRLQQIQNSLARILSLKLLSPVISLPRSLLWLRITKRIKYKLLPLTYDVLTTIQPTFLQNLIFAVIPRCCTVTVARLCYCDTFCGPSGGSSYLRYYEFFRRWTVCLELSACYIT